MEKTLISRADLAAKVLAAIREHEACRDVVALSITPVEMGEHGRTWHVNISDSGAASLEVSVSVARQVTEKLEPLFEVID